MGSNGSGSPMMRGFSAGLKNVVGFNPQEVKTSYFIIMNAIMDILGDMKHLFERQQWYFRDTWASPEGVTYCEKLAKEENIFLRTEAVKLNNITKTVRDAAIKWSIATGYYDMEHDLPADDFAINFIDVNPPIESCVMPDKNGVVGCDPERLKDAGKYIYSDAMYNDVLSGISRAKRSVDRCGFVGANQLNNLKQQVDNLLNAFKSKVDSIADEVNKKAVEIANKYTLSAEQVAQTFRNMNI